MADRQRVYPGVKGPRPDKAVARREIEAERLEWWRSLTPAKQLAELDRRLGKGVGAQRQRARLQALLKGPKAVAVETKEEVQKDPERRPQKAKDRRKAERKKKG